MLRSLNKITGYTIIDAAHEPVGQANDFYFDNKTWTVRYLVVDTGVWLPGRKVLIAPTALGQPDWGGGVSFPINLTKEEIENSPPVDTDKPVSRQVEMDVVSYHDWPAYWEDVSFMEAGMVGMNPAGYLSRMNQASSEEQAQVAELEELARTETVTEPYLRSVNEVIGYYIQARDGDIGHVEDFIVETETWAVQYMIIDTGNWLPGKKVLIAPHWVQAIDWNETKVFIDLTQHTIEKSPEYDPSEPVNRDYENRLFDYYGRPKYWT